MPNFSFKSVELTELLKLLYFLTLISSNTIVLLFFINFYLKLMH